VDLSSKSRLTMSVSQSSLVAAASNTGMKLTNLSEAPGETEAPLRALRRFAAVRTGS